MLAHEYGHHVQDLSGTPANGRPAGAPEELRAHRAPGRLLRRGLGEPRRETGYLDRLTDADIADGLNAAAAVGDDRIQKEFAGG